VSDIDNLEARGQALLKEGNWKGAFRTFEEAIAALEMDRSGGDVSRKRLAGVLRMRAFAGSRIGEFREAVDDAKKAMAISASLKDPEGEADALRRLGYVYWQKTDFTMALEIFEEALAKAVSCKARGLEGKIKLEMGNVYNSMGEFKNAVDSYIETAGILKETGDLNDLARVYNNLGSCFMNNNDPESAINSLQECVEIADRIGDTTIKGWASANLAECLVMTGRPAEAKIYLGHALFILRRNGDNIGVAGTYKSYGVMHVALGEWDLAEATFKKGLELTRGLIMPALEGEILMEMGKMYKTRDDIPHAKEWLMRSLEVFSGADLKNEIKKVEILLQGLD